MHNALFVSIKNLNFTVKNQISHRNEKKVHFSCAGIIELFHFFPLSRQIMFNRSVHKEREKKIGAFLCVRFLAPSFFAA